jgi:hypothetical protein
MATKQKMAKEKARRRRIEKARHVAQNTSKARFYLAVKLPAGWKKAMAFKTEKDVDAYVESVEDIRRRNASDIVEGKIFEIGSGREVRSIAPHTMEGPDIMRHHQGMGKREESGSRVLEKPASSV